MANVTEATYYTMHSVRREGQGIAKTSDRMGIGEIGVLVDPRTYHGEIVLRTYSGLVSLSNPHHTWVNNVDLAVRILPQTAALTLSMK